MDGFQYVVLKVWENFITSLLHEWLSGGVSPCQGEGRGFESRLVLFLLPEFPYVSRGSGFFRL